MGRSRQIAAEVAAALAKGEPHPEATVADWKKLVADIQKRARHLSDPGARTLLQHELDAAYVGLRAAEKVAAHQPTFVTSTNLFALKEMVLKHGTEFPRRVDAVDAPHLKRCVAAGLVEVNGTAKLTAAGREHVADELIKDIARESKWSPKPNPFLSGDPDHQKKILARDVADHDAKVAHLEATLAKLTR